MGVPKAHPEQTRPTISIDCASPGPQALDTGWMDRDLVYLERFHSDLLTRTTRDTFELWFGGGRDTRRLFKGKVTGKRFITAMTAKEGSATGQGVAALYSAEVRVFTGQAMGCGLAGAVVVRGAGLACPIFEDAERRPAR